MPGIQWADCRIPKGGGPLDKLITGIGHPFHIAADDRGIYWAEDPPGTTGYASGRLAGSGLMGVGTVTLVDKEPTALAVTNGTIVYSLRTEIDAISTSGGETRVVVGNLVDAGMMVAEGGRVAWVDPADPAIEGPTSPVLMSACIPLVLHSKSQQ